jgi:hypothetical protein
VRRRGLHEAESQTAPLVALANIESVDLTGVPGTASSGRPAYGQTDNFSVVHALLAAVDSYEDAIPRALAARDPAQGSAPVAL